jgi:hypothetical protein
VRDDIIVMRDETRNLTGKRHHLFEGEDPPPSGVPTDARILEGEGARLQSLAQLPTVGNCLTKGSPRRNLERRRGQTGYGARAAAVTQADVARNGLQGK